MRRECSGALAVVLFSAAFFPASVFSQDAIPAATGVERAIDRGLAFLAKDAVAWREAHNCASCHHAALVVWSMREAKLRGHVVDDAVFAEMLKWVADSGEGKTGVPRPEGRPKALNTKAVYFALALAADPSPEPASIEGMKRYWKTIQGDQIENGSWVAWPETRPPFFGPSDESMTVLATLALLPAADDTAKTARDKAIAWLTATKTDDDPQSVALRLVLWRRLDRPAEEWTPLVERIQARQNADGGWSQTKELASDAWATGQALYALALANVGAGEPCMTRAHAFLIKSQRDDGSWPMTSRPTKPGGEGSKSLIPITGAGTAWGVLGLVRSKSQRVK